MKIYTKVGDKGTTGLFGGPRVPKDHRRVAAYGDVDELNSSLGLARADCQDAELQAILARLQNQLFDLGSELATPDASRAPRVVPVVTEDEIVQMEQEIDRFDEELEPLRAFVLPAGTRLAADLHLARTICRRAERSIVTLDHSEPVDPEILKYVNRLSDLLFTLARVANHRGGVPEVKWEPRSRA
jgi:cob(I)alamin adenosyltransferase